jgi:DNA repair photolyase
METKLEKYKKFVAIGFSLSGHDEMEPGASPNAERIAAMRKLHEAGFKTWASIEPIIDFESSLQMIAATQGFCDLYKIGLESGREYTKIDIQLFAKAVVQFEGKLYFKDSLLKQAGIRREDLPGNCVGRDYNMFND